MGKGDKVSWEDIAEHTTEEKKVRRPRKAMASPARVH